MQTNMRSVYCEQTATYKLVISRTSRASLCWSEIVNTLAIAGLINTITTIIGRHDWALSLQITYQMYIHKRKCSCTVLLCGEWRWLNSWCDVNCPDNESQKVPVDETNWRKVVISYLIDHYVRSISPKVPPSSYWTFPTQPSSK